MNLVTNSVGSDDNSRLADPELRRLIERFVRRRVPGAEVDDVVQTVLVDALAAANVPDDDEQLRKWLFGITRHKVADFHRRGGRAKHVELSDEVEGEQAPVSAREWAQWAEKQTEGNPDEQRTLDWMAREGAGEKLAHIAEDENVPAPQVRQRVSRLRRLMRQRWAMELSAVAAVVILALIAWQLMKEERPTAEDLKPVPEKVPGPEIEEGRKLRADALKQCDTERWQRCIDGLDAAAELDPNGDAAEPVKAARSRARKALDDARNDANEESKTPIDSKLQQKAPAPTVSAPPPPKSAPPVFKKPSPKKQPRPTKPAPNISNKPSPFTKGGKSDFEFNPPPQQAPPQQQQQQKKKK